MIVKDEKACDLLFIRTAGGVVLRSECPAVKGLTSFRV